MATMTLTRELALTEASESAAVARQEAVQAKLEAERYHALHALETLQQELAAARVKFNYTLDRYDLHDWVETDELEDFHMIRTIEEYLARQ